AAALPFEELGEALTDCDYLVNTVPARVLDEGQLCCLPEEALLLELASAPGGFDRALAENLGLRCIAAPGLPGTAAPRSAAELMRAELERAMKEERDA
ncbi:MAG: dipicolinic acid synthetase subunit A, partial [Oscillospiraceae bacterium]|nr:dipicolinic acid synthetase subunit A [Oscillospiraceae bacterium]